MVDVGISISRRNKSSWLINHYMIDMIGDCRELLEVPRLIDMKIIIVKYLIIHSESINHFHTLKLCILHGTKIIIDKKSRNVNKILSHEMEI